VQVDPTLTGGSYECIMVMWVGCALANLLHGIQASTLLLLDIFAITRVLIYSLQ